MVGSMDKLRLSEEFIVRCHGDGRSPPQGYTPQWVLSWSELMMSMVIMGSIIHSVHGDHSVHDLVQIEVKQIFVGFARHAFCKKRINMLLA